MNLYGQGMDDAHAGKQPSEEHCDQPYYMHGWNTGRRDYDLTGRMWRMATPVTRPL
ncbi:hypothetical protein [Aquitalea magnusonii]|uniref:Uncharacterized protein n=1 Tax=Aquitalea magnusonii TaxID=332411 RepID=A0A318J4E3_9NEIS|nr:hypothetical protein [Aquitalea magnusonii]PXX42252.1 hypothetical protein DFR38_12049 [Aquitalea magnusonii]